MHSSATQTPAENLLCSPCAMPARNNARTTASVSVVAVHSNHPARCWYGDQKTYAKGTAQARKPQGTRFRAVSESELIRGSPASEAILASKPVRRNMTFV